MSLVLFGPDVAAHLHVSTTGNKDVLNRLSRRTDHFNNILLFRRSLQRSKFGRRVLPWYGLSSQNLNVALSHTSFLFLFKYILLDATLSSILNSDLSSTGSIAKAKMHSLSY